jgi:hypothetical protein
MNTTLKSLAAGAVILMAPPADAGQFLVPGPGGLRPAPLYGRGYVPFGYRRGYGAPRYYAPQHRPDLGAAIAGALAGAALQLIPRAAEALAARLPPPAPAPQPPAASPAPPPAATPAPPAAAVPAPPDDVLADIEGNSRGITREEVEAALVDWCASHGDAPLCRKLQVR